jgi:cell division protein FtsX
MPYTLPFFDVDSPAMAMALRGLQIVISLLLVVVAVNVAILVYARTTTRLGEIAVRTALGASRRRVLAQLFVEGLVLSIVAAILGLTVTGMALGRAEVLLDATTGGELPFWFSLDISLPLIAYVVALAVIGGAIVGVLPALKATGRHIQTSLQQLAARGSRLQLGRTWTLLVVTQVAFAVAILPAAVFWPGVMVSFGAGDPGFAIDEFVSGWVTMEREEHPPTARAAEYEREFAARFADRRVELLRRLRSEPGIDATFASTFPGRGEPPVRVEFEAFGRAAGSAPATDGGVARDEPGLQSLGVLVNHVGVDLFEIFDVPMVAGRAFVDADAGEGSRAVIVNQTFADRIAGGANAVGRLIRYADGAGVPSDESGREQWYEIVGVVPDFPEPMLPEIVNAAERMLYHPLAPGDDRSASAGLNPSGTSLMLVARTRGRSAAGLIASLRDITAAVDPALQLHELSTVVATRRTVMQGMRMVALGINVVTASVLLLSAAGIHAMMAFTVARRRREIGIRTALGADSRRILSGIFARAGAQLAIGVSIGLLFAMLLEWVTDGLIMGGRAPVVLPAVAAVILTVGLLAALGPARRGLAVEPTEVLREE